MIFLSIHLNKLALQFQIVFKNYHVLVIFKASFTVYNMSLYHLAFSLANTEGFLNYLTCMKSLFTLLPNTLIVNHTMRIMCLAFHCLILLS